jgi:hypothetical protein
LKRNIEFLESSEENRLFFGDKSLTWNYGVPKQGEKIGHTLKFQSLRRKRFIEEKVLPIKKKLTSGRLISPKINVFFVLF